MATKVFILANRNSASYLEKLVNKSWNIFSGRDGRKSGKKKDNAAFGDSTRHFKVEVLKNQEDFDKIDFTKSIKIEDGVYNAADKIFFLITPELFWNSNNVDEGYEKALNIIDHKSIKDSYVLQFRFLSVLPFKKLQEYSSPHLKRLVEAFPYIDLIGDQETIAKDLFAEYSPTHYHLIKRLAVSDTGYINILLHDISGLINSSLPSKEKDMHFLESITGLEYLNSGNNMISITMGYSFETRADVLSKIRDILNDLYIKVNNSDYHPENKLPYKVLVVEDEPVYRKFLKEMFSANFKIVDSIEPEKKQGFAEALKQWLPEKSESYDIILLDLLFKNENGNWAVESGFDLYKDIKVRNPFCVTPLVTSLPRAVVSSLVKELDETGIPYHLLLSKANGEEFLKLDFKDKLPDIVRTCRENEKRKKMFKPIPTEGIFKGLSVPGIMLNLMTKKKERFDEIVNISQSLFEKFKNGKLTISTPEWNKGELPSPQKIDSIDESYLVNKLPSILTHRLLVLYFSLKNDKKVVEILNYEKQVLNKGICNTSTLNNGYLNTKLGFSVEPYSEDDLEGFMIKFKHLFPHELLFVSEINKRGNDNVSLEKYKELYYWFQDILLEKTTFKNWKQLELNFYPYINTSAIDNASIISKSDVTKDITLTNFIDFLNALVAHFDNEIVAEIIDVAIEKYKIDERKIDLPSEIKNFIDLIFEL